MNNKSLALQAGRLDKINLRCYDPVAHILLDGLSIKPIMFGLFSIITIDVVHLLTATLTNTLWTSNKNGLFQDGFPWVGVIFASIIWGYYLWSYTAIGALTTKLDYSDAIEAGPAETAIIISRFYGVRWPAWLALCIATVGSISGFFNQQSNPHRWVGTGFWPNAVNTIFVLIGTYMCAILVINLLKNIQVLHTIFYECSVQINPFHPDRCGGLKALSDYSLKTTYLIALFGCLVGIISLSSNSQQVDWYGRLLLPVYLLLSVVCFFGPLLTAHDAMKRSKEGLLSEIAQQFKSDYSAAYARLSDSAESMNKDIEKIEQLRKFYSLTDEFPIWPFDVKTVRRYVLTLPAPVLPLFITLIKEWLLPLLKRYA